MPRPALPGFALSAGMLWLLAGALYKLFEGSPMDLPQVVTDRSPLDKWNTMRAAIAIELAVVGLVIALPRIGWVPLAGTFATFLAILTPLAMAGETSCGCFGGNITIDPKLMIGIDGGLLLLVLFSRPWRLPKEAGLGFVAWLPILAVAIAAPMLKMKEPELPPVKRPDLEVNVVGAPGQVGEQGSAADAPGSIAGSTAGSSTEEAPDSDGSGSVAAAGTTQDAEETASTATDVIAEPEDAQAEVAEVAPEPEYQLPEFGEINWTTWEGSDFFESDIGRFSTLDPSGAVLPGSHVVVYRRSCEVCKEHLEQLWTDAQNDPNHLGGKTLVLLRIEESTDGTKENLCELYEQGLPSEKVTLPALVRGYGVTTPMAFDVNEEYVIENVDDVRTRLGH